MEGYTCNVISHVTKVPLKYATPTAHSVEILLWLGFINTSLNTTFHVAKPVGKGNAQGGADTRLHIYAQRMIAARTMQAIERSGSLSVIVTCTFVTFVTCSNLVKSIHMTGVPRDAQD